MNHHQNEIQDKSSTDFVQAAAQKYGIPGVAIGEWEAGPGQFASAISAIDYWLQERREGLVRIRLAKQLYN